MVHFPLYLQSVQPNQESNVFVLGDDEDLEDVLKRIAGCGQYGCVLVDNFRMDEPAQVRIVIDV